MYKGHIDIDFLTAEMLAKVKFTHHNHVPYTGGYWEERGIPIPDYPYDGPWIYQVFDNDCPIWAHEIKHMFDDVLKYQTVTVNMIRPGRFIPPHTDQFYNLYKNAPEDVKTLNLKPVRLNVFLQNAQVGHFFEMDMNMWTDYVKGDYTVIKQGIPHSVVNIGCGPRYTLQVSGFCEANAFK